MMRRNNHFGFAGFGGFGVMLKFKSRLRLIRISDIKPYVLLHEHG